jgi:single-strand DNA-binding protein
MANLNFNKIILGGRLTADPELKQTTNAVLVTSFTIAVNRKGAQGQTDFIDCVAWRGAAEIISKYFRKGSSILVTGSLQRQDWTDKDGNKRYSFKVVVDEATFVDSKGESAPMDGPSFTTNLSNFEEMEMDEPLPF